MTGLTNKILGTLISTGLLLTVIIPMVMGWGEIGAVVFAIMIPIAFVYAVALAYIWRGNEG